MRTVSELAERHIDWPMPGYTHLQRAQPSTSHHLLAYFWMFRRDVDRFACASTPPRLPLGAGALAGVNWSRSGHARELGFAARRRELARRGLEPRLRARHLSAAAVCAMHLSRLGAEIVLWSSEEFGFLELGDSFTSGSSIMPQKKNPDAAELLRAKAPRVAGTSGALLGVMHALPLAYNKDIQEDKERLFDAVDTLAACLEAACWDARAARLFSNRARLAERLPWEPVPPRHRHRRPAPARQGVPFRESHGVRRRAREACARTPRSRLSYLRQ